MKTFEQAVKAYRKEGNILNTFKDINAIDELKFRIWCIKNKTRYETQGFGDISSLVLFLQNLLDKRKNPELTIALLYEKELYSAKEAVEELQIAHLINEAYYQLLKINTNN